MPTVKKSPLKKARKKVATEKTSLERNEDGREIIYPKVKVNLCSGDSAITIQQAKELLGWEEETDNRTFKGDCLLQYSISEKESNGKITTVRRKVRCTNNINNRPLYKSVYETLTQEILRRRWRLNGETIIVGDTGLILNGQHQLVSLVLAVQKWRDNKDKYPLWQTEPTMEKAIVYGIKEDDSIVNTMDTCKPRSLMDVIYRSEYFADMKMTQRKTISRMTEHAVKLLWHRTGAALDAFAPKRTHSESIDFLNRHITLLRAAKHIFTEDGRDKSISRYVTPGYAAGMLYLMAAAETDLEENDSYSSANNPNEDHIYLHLFEKSEEFFTILASRGEELNPLRDAFDQFESAPSLDERLALLVKAWNAWSNNEKLTKECLSLKYEKNNDGWPVLAECPVCGGIDLGNPE